ncbi:MAG: ABC transporter substrate-binding protein [Nitrososphaeraceae archaeon]
MELTRKFIFVIVLSLLIFENSIIYFAKIEEKEHYSHLIIVLNSLLAVLVAIFVLLRQSTDKKFHLKTRISVTLGLCLWFLANLVWAIYSIILEVVPPVPSIGDFLWLSAYGFLGYHLLLSFKKFRDKFDKKLIFSGFLVGAIFLTLMTLFTVSISSLENIRGVSMFIVLLLYPSLATLLLIFSIILHIGLRKDIHHSFPWMCDSLATLAIVVADSWFVLVVVSHLIDDIWISALFINAHYLIMASGLIWYYKYLTHRHDNKLLVRCHDIIQKKKRVSIAAVSIIGVFAIISVFPNPLNPFDFSSHSHEKEIGIAHASSNIKQIKLGVLLPITGTLSSIGESGLTTLKIVAEEINNYLSDIKSDYRIRLLVEDTKTDPTESLKKLKLFKENEVNMVIGPASSSALMHLKKYADENNILIVSYSSTSPSFSNIKDNIFRLIPDDINQAKAVSKKIWDDGIRIIVPMWRSDIYGNDLLNYTKMNFEDLGGIVADGIKYNPPVGHFAASLSRANYVFWGQDLIDLNYKVRELSNVYPLEEIGVYIIAFDEIVPIFSQGNSHPLLQQVRWYGNEATAKSEKIITNYESSLFADKTDYVAPVYELNETKNKKLHHFLKKYQESHTEAFLTFDGPYLYDSVWLAALSKIKSNNTNDVELLKKTFMNVSYSFMGITGPTKLNLFGDRLYGEFDFWEVKKEENEAYVLKWNKIDSS